MIQTLNFKGGIAFVSGTYLLSWVSIAASILYIYSQSKKINPQLANATQFVPKKFLFGLIEDQNVVFRNTMEDKTLAVNFEMNGHNFSLFGIYDGHGGEEIAQLVKDEFLQILQAELQTCDCSNNALKKALTNAYLKMDEKCLEKEKELNGRTVGSCALTALIVDGQLQIANAGDSRAVIFNNNSAMRLSKDHNAKYKDCQDEVEEKGCQVWNGKIAGALSVTRAFGDQKFKTVVSAEPTFYKKSINLSDCSPDAFLILACDGIWDVLDDKDATAFVQNKINEGRTLQEAS